MQTAIGDLDAETASVPVIFDHAGVVHHRTVNAVFDEDGNFDEAATGARVAEVARGVAEKIALGVITNPEPEPEA